MDEILTQLQEAVIIGEPEQALALAEQTMATGIAPLTAIEEALQPAMQTVGEKYETGEYFIPDLVMAAEAMKSAMTVFEPALAARHEVRQMLGTVVIGTIEGDIHEIGKSLVGTMLSAAGFQVHDLGVDVSVESFVQKAQETQADVIGVSALLTTTMLKQEAVVKALEEAGLREKVKVIVGGAPASADWAETIGADGYAENANEAVGMVKRLLGV